ncbi:Uncharacterised protein [Klebsiella pneumoniae]|uniref:Uncharacterized protein n=1 Tax=Klebsiella pneumoniae TaxID=573 RepID=A0A378H6F6_KLEPN|nr:Uncharacterised protein [Klebsiella pneumoniae]
MRLGVTVKYDWVTQIVSMLGSNLGLESSAVRFFVDSSSDDILTMMDPDGVIFLRLTKDFQLLTRINMGGSVSGQDTIARMSKPRAVAHHGHVKATGIFNPDADSRHKCFFECGPVSFGGDVQPCGSVGRPGSG